MGWIRSRTDEKISQMFVAGPPVVKRVGEDLTKEELGGYNIHSKNGVIDNLSFTEKEAMDKIGQQ